jgi:hypothetical protein
MHVTFFLAVSYNCSYLLRVDFTRKCKLSADINTRSIVGEENDGDTAAGGLLCQTRLFNINTADFLISVLSYIT